MPLLFILLAVLGGFLTCLIAIVIPLWEQYKRLYYRWRSLKSRMYSIQSLLKE